MRALVTFILRLWVDPRAGEPAWEGQVECVIDGARAHVCNREELGRFIEDHISRHAESRPDATDGTNPLSPPAGD